MIEISNENILEIIENEEVLILKDEAKLIAIFQKINLLEDEYLYELLKTVKVNYISNLAKVCALYKLGKIKKFRHELDDLCSFLLIQKKYTRIYQLQKILNMFQINLESYNDILDKVNLRMNGSNIEKFINFCEFDDVVNNANIYIKNIKSLNLFFEKADLFALDKFLSGLFKSLKSIEKKNELKSSICKLYEKSGNKKLKEFIEAVYRDLKLDNVKVLSNPEKIEVYQNVVNEVRHNVSEVEKIKQRIIELKYELHEEELNKGQFIFLINELVFNYEKLNDLESANKLKDYLSLKLGMLNE